MAAKTLKKPPAKGGATKVDPTKPLPAGTLLTCSSWMGFKKAEVKVKSLDKVTKKITATDTSTGKAVIYDATSCTMGGSPSSTSGFLGVVMDGSKPIPKEIKKGTSVLCKTMWGSTDFKVNSINAQTRKVTGNNPKTGAPITYSASSCTVFNPSGDVVDASTPPKAIKAGTPVMCKTMFGSTDFRATSVNIKTRKVTGNNPKTGKPITYSASDCTVGEPSASGKLMDKGNNKEIKKGSFVLCKTLVSSADITVDYIDMNKKTVTGNNPKTGKPITYSASSCSVANKPPPGAVYDKTTPPKAIMKGSYVKCTTYAGSTDFTVTSVDVACVLIIAIH